MMGGKDQARGRRAVVVALGAAALVGCNSPPTLALRPPIVDLGAVPENQTVTASVTLVNLANTAVTATYVEPGCPQCFNFVDDGGSVLFESVLVSGLPVTLAPLSSATLNLKFYAFADFVTHSPNVDSKSSPVGRGNLYYDENPSDFVTLIVTASVIPQCNPPSGTPPMDGMGIGGGTNYRSTFNQQDWQCSGALAGDAGLGIGCISGFDCPTFCCECPGNNATTCASFAGGACMGGTCAPPEVACDVVGSNAAFCPDAALTPSHLGGPAAFTPVASGSRYSQLDGGALLNVALTSTDGGAVCSGEASGPSSSALFLAVSLPPGSPTQFVPGVFTTPQLQPGGQAITELVGPDGGLSVTGGYVFLSRLDTDGSSGSFDSSCSATAPPPRKSGASSTRPPAHSPPPRPERNRHDLNKLAGYGAQGRNRTTATRSFIPRVRRGPRRAVRCPPHRISRASLARRSRHRIPARCDKPSHVGNSRTCAKRSSPS